MESHAKTESVRQESKTVRPESTLVKNKETEG